MSQHQEKGKDLVKYHCNACNESFYIAAEDDAYYCPFCGSETGIYQIASWWVLAPVDKTRMDDDILVTPQTD